MSRKGQGHSSRKTRLPFSLRDSIGLSSARFWTAFCGFALALIVVFAVLLVTGQQQLGAILEPFAAGARQLSPEALESLLAHELDRKLWLALSVFVWLMAIFTLIWALWHRYVEKLLARARRERGEVETALAHSREAEEALAHQAEELREANRGKDYFISLLAHDLKNPFHSLLGLSEMLAEDADMLEPQQVRDYAEHIHRSGQQVYRLLQNLLDWSRMQRGMMPFEPESQPFAESVRETVFLFADSAREKSVALTFDATEDLLVHADENMLKAILRNLISNALKFTQRGGRITVMAAPAEGGVSVQVRDNGIGMEPRQRERLLAAAGALKGLKGTAGEEGTGLGLLLVREMVAAHGGSLDIESEPGAGSTFSVFFPKGPRKRRGLTRHPGFGATMSSFS